MRLIHRVGISEEPRVTNALRSLGVSFNGPESPLVRVIWFDFDESDPRWPELSALLRQWRASDIVHTEFNASERANAKYLEVSPTWHHKYPQPEDDFGYRRVTYDLQAYCTSCGIGRTQVAPFRVVGEPKWGKKHIFQLNWVFDEYFVLPAVWHDVFRPFGIECNPVLDHRTGDELRTVVQLKVTRRAESNLLMDEEYAAEICSACGRKKYVPISHGFFPAFANEPSVEVCKTQEYFGSGGSAWNAIIVTNSVYQSIRIHKLKGVTFVPLAT